jgi:Chemoreceptor zinc-binding domain
MSASPELMEVLEAAFTVHDAWIQQFYAFTHDAIQLDPDLVEKPDQCEFGQWLEVEGKAQLHPKDYRELLQRHAHFHLTAAHLLRLKNQGNHEAVRSYLRIGGGFTQAAFELSKYLIAIRDQPVPTVCALHPHGHCYDPPCRLANILSSM